MGLGIACRELFSSAEPHLLCSLNSLGADAGAIPMHYTQAVHLWCVPLHGQAFLLSLTPSPVSLVKDIASSLVICQVRLH